MRVGESIWYCQKLIQPVEEQTHSAPIEVVTRFGYFTVMGKSGYEDIIDIGADTSSRLTVIAQPYNTWKNTFKNGDLFYVNGVEPSEDEDFYGQNANYRVADVDYGNIRIKLRLEKVAEE